MWVNHLCVRARVNKHAIANEFLCVNDSRRSTSLGSTAFFGALVEGREEEGAADAAFDDAAELR